MNVSYKNSRYQHGVSVELTLEPINTGIELGLCLGALGEGSPMKASGVSCEACRDFDWWHLRWDYLPWEMLVAKL